MIGKTKTEDYLKEIYQLQMEKGCARGVELAKRLGVKRSTVCVAIRDLIEAGYAACSDEKEIVLTEQGKSIAASVVERYQFFLDLLRMLQISEETAKRDACLMEHCLSEESFQALKRYLQECRMHLQKETGQ